MIKSDADDGTVVVRLPKAEADILTDLARNLAAAARVGRFVKSILVVLFWLAAGVGSVALALHQLGSGPGKSFPGSRPP